MLRAIGAGQYFSSKGWTWTYLLHVHPPRRVESATPFKYWNFFTQMAAYRTIHYTGAGVGPGDTAAYQSLSGDLGGYHPTMGLIDADSHLYTFVP
jgi:hypothetical protein